MNKVKERKRLSFWKLYLIYVIILAAGVLAAVLYVNGQLTRYEELLPQRRVEEAVEKLKADAEKGELWSRFGMADVAAGSFEKHLDVKKAYQDLYVAEEVTFRQLNIAHAENELYYRVELGDYALAEIRLEAVGEAETMLAILTIREWEVASIKPLLEASDYEITVPADFTVQVNGISLTEKEGRVSERNEVTYTVEGLYLKPEFQIADKNGELASYVIKNGQVLPQIYHYTLTLPEALQVSLNGEAYEGIEVDERLVNYDICTLEKPEVIISDDYGNTYLYEGGNEIPLTYMTVLADERYAVAIENTAIPKEAVTYYPNKEYELLEAYVEKLPGIQECHIAILKEDAVLSVTNEEGKQVAFEEGQRVYDFTDLDHPDAKVPEEVAAQVDVLDVAQKWSLFMSKDYPISQLEALLLEDSYQHRMAVRYASSVDISFTSSHVLEDPAFTEISVTNYHQITEDCFSVDISFVKHMLLRNGKKVDDHMNDRFYFVDQDGWKLAGMKEIVGDE